MRSAISTRRTIHWGGGSGDRGWSTAQNAMANPTTVDLNPETKCMGELCFAKQYVASKSCVSLLRRPMYGAGVGAKEQGSKYVQGESEVERLF